MTIAIAGAGAMGAALASRLARHGLDVSLLATSFDGPAAEAIRRDEPHPGLGMILPGGFEVVDAAGWPTALPPAEIVVLAVATLGLADTIAAALPHVSSGAVWVVATKGMHEQTLQSAAAVVAQEVGDASRVVALVGPSLAAEIAAGVPTGLAAACEDIDAARRVAAAFSSPDLRVEPTDDVAGVEVGATLKNIVAIAAGVCDGLAALAPHGGWLNTKALVFSRGLQEMASLAAALGGRTETVLGLAGAGDLFVTCAGGRNARFGRLIGEGLPAALALERMNTTVEGYVNARGAAKLAEARGLDLPIVRAVCSMLFEALPPADAIASIVSAR